MLALGGLRMEVLVSYSIGSFSVTQLITCPVISPPQAWPNFNPTPSTGTTGQQSVSAPTVGATYNEQTKMRSVDGYSKTQGEYRIPTRVRVRYPSYQSRSPYSNVHQQTILHIDRQ